MDNMTSLTAFPKFKSLPTELRLKIWHEAYQAEDPKIIELERCILEGPNPDEFCLSHTQSSPISPLLHTNREARFELIKSTDLTFSLTQPLNGKPHDLTLVLSMDFEHDVVAINIEDTDMLNQLGRREHITKLLLLSPCEHRHPRLDNSTSSLNTLVNTHFPKLKELYLSVAELPGAGSEDETSHMASDPDLYEDAPQIRSIDRDGNVDFDIKSAPLSRLDENANHDCAYGEAFESDVFKADAIAQQLSWIREKCQQPQLEVIRLVAVQRKQKPEAFSDSTPLSDWFDERWERSDRFLYEFWLKLDAVIPMVKYISSSPEDRQAVDSSDMRSEQVEEVEKEVFALWLGWAKLYWPRIEGHERSLMEDPVNASWDQCVQLLNNLRVLTWDWGDLEIEDAQDIWQVFGIDL